MIFSSTDPMHRKVILKEHTWNNKILQDHPEVEPYINEIKSLMTCPYYILRDLHEVEPGNKEVHPTREEYIDLIRSKTKPNMILLRAIVDHVTNPGEVVTVIKSNKLRGLTTEGGVVYVKSKTTT
ncbi:MAG: hypothetical protein K9L17_10375 [Clostridiales bacterium]|nr:hypothetical protein [Clostridiales bacterium]MCF8023086.1 hypothetical protein [Clostridiales bacterium]